MTRLATATEYHEVTDLIYRLMLSFDGDANCDWKKRDQTGPWAKRFFTANGAYVTPFKTSTGHDAIVEAIAENMRGYAQTQHVATNVIVDVDDDGAAHAGWHVIMTHVHADEHQPRTNLVVGGRWSAKVVKVDEGKWQFERATVNPIWMTGDLRAEDEKFMREHAQGKDLPKAK